MGTRRSVGGWVRRVQVSVLVAITAIVAVAAPNVSAAAVPEEAATALAEPDPLEVDRDQDRMAEAVEESERITAEEGAVKELPPGAADGLAGPDIGGAEDPSILVPDEEGVAHPPAGAGPIGVPEVVAPALSPSDAGLVAPATTPDALTDAVQKTSTGLDAVEAAELAERASELDLTQLDEGDEVEELRTESSQTFIDEDGKLRTEIGTEPIFIESANGEYVEPDDIPKGSRDERWRPAAGREGLSFGATARDAELAILDLGDGRRMSWSLEGAARAAGESTRDAVRYEDVFDGVDLELQSSLRGVKETIAIADASAPRSYDFPLQLEGLKAVLNDEYGSILLNDTRTGKQVAAIPSAWAEDSNRAAHADPGPVSYELIGTGRDPVLRVTVDEAWFTDPARKFPVIVDPTAVASTFAMTGDAYANSGWPTMNYSTQPNLKVGYGEGHRRNYFARWDVGWLVASSIIEADYHTLNTYSYSCTPASFDVYRVTSNWNPATVSWNTQPSFDPRTLKHFNVAHGYGGTCAAAGDLKVPMRDLVQNWVDGKVPAYGVTGRTHPNENYNDPYTYKWFASTEVGGQRLAVVWSPYRAKYGVTPGSVVQYPTGGTDGQIRVRVTNKAPTLWKRAGTGRIRLGYHIYQANGTTLCTVQSCGFDGWEAGRTDLPADVGWGKFVDVTVNLVKRNPGNYVYKFDLLREGDAKPYFTQIGAHPDLYPMPIRVNVGNQPSSITSATPAGLSETRTPTLKATGKNPDNYPAGAVLKYHFRICEDEELTVNCQHSGGSPTTWQTSDRFDPVGLEWGKTYYWNADIKEEVAGGATNLATWKVPLTPTVVQPKLERHFGSDSNVPAVAGVNPSIGNYVSTVVDVQIAAAGLPLELTRTYNSKDTRAGAFGPGWSTSLDLKATPEANGKLLISYPDGHQERYGQNADSSWTSPPENPSVLTGRDDSDPDTLPNNGWELRRPDLSVYVFDVEGRLIAQRDGWGNTLTFERTSPTGPVTKVISAPSQRFLTIGWEPEGPEGASVITSVEAIPPQAGQTAPRWTYDYTTDGRLQTVCAPGEPEEGAACSTYAYYTTADTQSSKVIGKLKWAKRQEGNYAVQLEYTGGGSAKAVENGVGKKWTFSNDDAIADGTYHPLVGATLLNGSIGTNATISVDVGGVGGIPNGAQAVVLNVSAVGSSNGWIAAYPGNTPEPPGVSTMDYHTQVRSTLNTVAVGSTNTVNFTNHGQAIYFSVEAVGWYGDNKAPDGSVYVPVSPSRILDTRQPSNGGKLTAGHTRQIEVLDKGGIPTEGVRAVVYNLEALSPTADTNLTAFPKGATRPNISTLRTNTGRVIDNLHITKVGADGSISLYNSAGQVDVTVNVVGYFADPAVHDGSVYRPVTNQRLLDSRKADGQWFGSPAPAGTRTVMVTGEGTLPDRGVTAVVGDLQSLQPVGVNPIRTDPSGASGNGTTYLGQNNLNVGNHMYTGIGNGGIDVVSTKSAHLLVDVVGYFTPVPRTTYIQDPRGNLLEYRFDSNGRLVSRTDEADNITAYSYDDEGRLAQTMDHTLAATKYKYDDNGRVLEQTRAQYDLAGTSSAYRDPSPLTEDPLEIVWSSTSYFHYKSEPTNPAVDGKLEWTSDGRSENADDPSYRTTYAYDDRGQPLKIHGPALPGAEDGVGIDRTFTTGAPTPGCPQTAPPGLKQTEADEKGLVTTYCYDPNGDLRELRHPSGLVEKTTYDDLGRAVNRNQVSSGLPELTTLTVYDLKGRVVQETDPRVTSLITNPSQGRHHRAASVTNYTPNGNVERVLGSDIETGLNHSVTYSYDDADRPTGSEDSAGRTTSRSYDDNGNLATETGADGQQIAYTYNSRNLTEYIIAKDVVDDPLADPGTPEGTPHDVNLTYYGYDRGGRQVSEVDANGRSVRHYWRADAKLEQSVLFDARETDPDTGLPSGGKRPVLMSSTEYDAAGHSIATSSPTNVVTTDEFDGSSLSSSWQTTGSWGVSDGELVASAPGMAWRPGTKDGQIHVVTGAANAASVRFRVKDASNYCEVWNDGWYMEARQVVDGEVKSFQRVYTGGPDEGDWFEVSFTGNRLRVFGNNQLLLTGWIPTDTDDTGVGVMADTAGQGFELFRFDAFQRTENEFDAYGRQTASTIDPGGTHLRTEYARQPDGRPVSIRMMNGAQPGAVQEKRFGYYPVTGLGAGQMAWSDEVISNPDPESSADDVVARTSYEYDARGLQTKAVLPEGGEVTSTYDEVGQLTSTTGPARTITRYGQPDALNQRSTEVYGYDAFGNRIDEQDPAGRLTSHEYDDRGFLVETTLAAYTPPGGTAITRTISRTYDDAGRVLTETDPLGRTTESTYNTRGFKVAQEDPAVGSAPAGVSRWAYDPAGQLVEQKDPTGALTRYRLDDLGRPAGVEEWIRQPSLATNVSSSTFGDAGGVLRTRSAEGVVATSEYDVAGQLLRTRDADGNPTTYAYDDFGRVTALTAPDGRKTVTTYNLVGDTLSQTVLAADGTALGESRLTWDTEHRNLTAASPRGVAGDESGTYATTFAYDKAGQLLSKTTPVRGGASAESIIETWGYDELGQTTRHTDGRNNTTWQTYNTMGLPEDSIAPAAGSHTAVADRRWRNLYDAAGNPVTQSAPGGVSIASRYDELGRLTYQEGAGAQAATATRMFEYDLRGDMTKASTTGTNQDFTFDDRGLLLSSAGSSGASSFAYDKDGRLTKRTDGSGIADFTYDNRGLPDTMVSSLSGTVGFDFDASGRPETVSHGNGTNRAISYDDWGRVHQDTLTTGTTNLYSVEYGYDADGNVTKKDVSGTNVPVAGNNTYTYDRSSRITSWQAPTGPVENYSWDKNSNRTSSGPAASPTTAAYDEQNRLVSTSGPGGVTTNTWNSNGSLDQQAVQRRVSLVVADPANLTAAENVLYFVAVVGTNSHVSFIDDNAAAPAATSVDVIVISPSVDPTALGTKYRDIAAPVVNVSAATWQASGLTSAAPTTTTGTSAHIADAAHPVAAGKTGTVALVTAADSINQAPVASLGAGAVQVVTTSSSSTDTVAAAYEAGSATPAGAAAARRVTIGLSAGAASKMASHGGDIYGAAITWADDNTATTFGTTNFDFDAFEQLSKITSPTGTVTNHTYDGLGRRLTSPSGALSYAGTSIRPSADGAHRYQPGPSGSIAIDDLVNGSGVWGATDAHTDVVGQFTAGAQGLSSSQAFSPWGVPMGTQGEPMPLGFQSERQDLPGGLVGMGVREYNPATGTFISRDPANDTSVGNTYAYTAANPMGFTDPTGMWPSCGLCEKAIDKGKEWAGKAYDKSGLDSLVAKGKGAWDWFYDKSGFDSLMSAGRDAWDWFYDKSGLDSLVQRGKDFYNDAKEWVGNRIDDAKRIAGQVYNAGRRAYNATVRTVAAATNWVIKESPMAAAVRGGMSAVANYAGRLQRVGGQLIDTGIASLAQTPLGGLVVKAVEVVTTPSIILDGLGSVGSGLSDWGGDVWDASGGAIVHGIASCAGDLKGCGANVVKFGAAVGAGLLTTAVCAGGSLGTASAGCVVAGFAVGGGVYGALNCPAGESRLKCAGIGATSGTVAGIATVACGGNAFCGGVAGDATAQLLTTGKVNLAQSTGSGILAYTGQRAGQSVVNRVRAIRAPAGHVPDPEPVFRPSGAPNRDSPWYVSYKDAAGNIQTVGNSGGLHAEVRIQQMQPGTQMSRPFGWRTVVKGQGPQWVPGTVCANCQIFPPSLFPPGTRGAPGGPWGDSP